MTDNYRVWLAKLAWRMARKREWRECYAALVEIVVPGRSSRIMAQTLQKQRQTKKHLGHTRHTNLEAGMNDKKFIDRAALILHNMTLERRGWRGFFRRWYISDEPLRNDAANLLREAGFEMQTPLNCRRVGEVEVARIEDNEIKDVK